jgi:ligand-binding sensor domain-containing protein
LQDKYLVAFENIPCPGSDVINAIIRDDRGFIWLGTPRGLCKYDGYRAQRVGEGFPTDGPPVIITSIIKLEDGALLIATGAGLWTFDPRTERFSPFLADKPLAGTRINALLEDSAGTIWIGTEVLGLYSYSRRTKILESYTRKSGLSDSRVNCLLLDHTGEVWIGTVAGGLNVFDPTTRTFGHYRASSSDPTTLNSDHIMALCENGRDELWAGTDQGLNVLHRETGHVDRIDLHSTAKHNVNSIVRDPGSASGAAPGRLWIGASELGLLSFFDRALTRVAAKGEDGRSLNTVISVYPDPVASTAASPLLWVGTRSGMDRLLLSKTVFRNYARGEDGFELNRGAVLSLCEGRSGILWVGLWGGGLNGFRREGDRYRRIVDLGRNPMDRLSLPGNDVESIHEDREGRLWVGTSDGLAVLDKLQTRIDVTRHVEGDTASLPSSSVMQIFEDRRGGIWVCTRGGLSRLIGEMRFRFKNYLNDPASAHPLGGNVVSSIMEDRSSNLWLATYGRGLVRMDSSGKFTRFASREDSSGVRVNWVYSIAEGAQGTFWLSTRAGLVSFEPRSGEFTGHPIDPSYESSIFSIAPDNGGNLWLSRSTGLVRFDPSTGSTLTFGLGQGLLFREFFSGFLHSGRGTLLFGGIDGFVEFSPDSIQTSSRPPQIAITDFSLIDRDLPASAVAAGEIRLDHTQNFFSFSFAALDYVNPSSNRFAYQMSGVDDRWVLAGSRNYASYTHLDPGRYVFRVKGCNSDNVWNETGASLSIVIVPPYWQTWWFRIAAAAAALAASYAVYRYRVRSLLRVDRLRLRIAEDLHDDVGSNLSTIAIVSRTLQNSPHIEPSTRRTLSEIYETAVTTGESMRDIVWFIKPKGDTISDMLLRMKDTASSMLSDLEHDFLAPERESSGRIGIDFKRNFFLAFKEILNNIVKHSGATRIEIRVEQRDGMLELIVRDNGRGFDYAKTSSVGRGSGLGNLRRRAESLKGACEIVSSPGTGTEVRISARL